MGKSTIGSHYEYNKDNLLHIIGGTQEHTLKYKDKKRKEKNKLLEKEMKIKEKQIKRIKVKKR